MAGKGGAGGLLVAGHGDVVVGHGADFGNGRSGQVALELEDFEGRGGAGAQAGFAGGEGLGGKDARLPGGVNALGRGLDLARGVVGFDEDALLEAF